MILFILSFLMVFASSYFLASCFEEKKYASGFLYLMLISFAQVVLSIEILSLFSAISPFGILILNALFLAGSVFYWQKRGKPFYRSQPRKFAAKIIKALKKDKMLAVLSAGLIFFIAVSLFLCYFMPVMTYDSLAYHFNRAIFWVAQGNLNHFEIADDRNLVMAINSEILYTWLLTFAKKNVFMGFFSFAGYVLSAISLYSILEIMGFNTRKRLWALFMLSSVAGVVLETSGTETDIIIGALMLCSACLFLLGAKKSKFTPIYFSSLSMTLAIGTKSTTFFFLPACALLFTYFLLRFQKQNFWKYTKFFIGVSLANFFIFASYNYVLNFLHFGNPMGSAETRFYHGAEHTLKGFISGFIRHFLLLFDFTGFIYADYLAKWIFAVQNKILAFLHIPLDYNVISDNNNLLNRTIMDPYVGGGIIGVIVFLPCVFISTIRGFFKRKDTNSAILGLFGFGLFLCIAAMSLSIGFMLFSARFTTAFIIFCSPIFVYSYIKSNKNIFKYIILFYAMSYLCIISTHLWGRHFVNITKELKKGSTIRQARLTHQCATILGFEGQMPFCALRSLAYKMPQGTKIGLFSSVGDNVAVLKMLEFEGYKIDTLLIENTHKYNLDKYDYLIYTDIRPSSALIENMDEITANYSVENRKLKFHDTKKAQCLVLDLEDHLVLHGNPDKLKTHATSCEIPYQILHTNNFYKIGEVLLRNNGRNPDNQYTIFKKAE